MEGVSRPVYRIAKELTQNSRSGLTIRFLSKKLELPEEEVEYLVDVNRQLLFTDLTKIKLAAEGLNAVKRITDGLENLGDVPSLFRRVKSMASHDFRELEERLGIVRPGAKKAVVEELIDQYYRHPDSIVEYVAGKNFSAKAHEIFDIVWQSKDGVMPVAKIRAASSSSEYEVEQALWELFRGCALFEMFRFDAEERLVRVAGLLTEIRQWREEAAESEKRKHSLKGKKTSPGIAHQRGLEFCDTICRVVASIAARPVRLRGDGELFREDRRRLSEIVREDAEPSLSTCLWAAEGIGWLGRVDNGLRAGNLEPLIEMGRFDRHKLLFDWMTTTGNEGESKRILTSALDEMKIQTWYPSLGFVRQAVHRVQSSERSILKSQGAHCRYVSPTSASGADKNLARSLEETLAWLGVVDTSEDGIRSYFRVSQLGLFLLRGDGEAKCRKDFGEKQTEIVVQPNFDIVVPTQDTDSLLAVPLDQFATRQSTGQATVYQLDKDSFTQALQDGHDGDTFVEFLLNHNRGGTLPSNVMTTLDDWRGGLRRVRLKTIHVLETDDVLVMAELMHRRKFRKHLEAVDPKRLAIYSEIPKAELTKHLEKDGFIVE
jgi:hypothetical protein